MPSDCEIEEIIPEPVVLNFSKNCLLFFSIIDPLNHSRLPIFFFH